MKKIVLIGLCSALLLTSCQTGLDGRRHLTIRDMIKHEEGTTINAAARALYQAIDREVSGWSDDIVAVLFSAAASTDYLNSIGLSPEEFLAFDVSRAFAKSKIFKASQLHTAVMNSLDGQPRQVKCVSEISGYEEPCTIDDIQV